MEPMVNNEAAPIIDVINTSEEAVLYSDKKIICRCAMADCLIGGVCYHAQKNSNSAGNGTRCDGDICNWVTKNIIKNTNAKVTDKIYYVTPAKLACQLTKGNIEMMQVSKEDLQKVIDDEAVIIYGNLVIGVKND